MCLSMYREILNMFKNFHFNGSSIHYLSPMISNKENMLSSDFKWPFLSPGPYTSKIKPVLKEKNPSNP